MPRWIGQSPSPPHRRAFCLLPSPSSGRGRPSRRRRWRGRSPAGFRVFHLPGLGSAGAHGARRCGGRYGLGCRCANGWRGRSVQSFPRFGRLPLRYCGRLNEPTTSKAPNTLQADGYGCSLVSRQAEARHKARDRFVYPLVGGSTRYDYVLSFGSHDIVYPQGGQICQ